METQIVVTMPIITLLTDFGTADGYVGEMKGVLLSLAPTATIVDVAHDVPAHDVDAARLTLARYWRRYPAGSVHLVVVDPGVGTNRAALAIASDGRFLVGPDNGVLSPALLSRDARAISVPIPAGASTTFHGRDVFAPAAARLATGVALETLGEPWQTPVVRRTPEPRRTGDGALHGEVITVDRFGNAITNLAGTGGTRVVVRNREVRLRRTYAELEASELGAIVGSNGFVEIVLREGRAADVLELARGTPVILR
jgi:S-adenosylmethionine hydrolase